MKPAQILDLWRFLRNTNKRTIRRIYVKWSGASRLSDGEIELSKQITLICGENGAGKSSLLHTLAHSVVREGDVVDNLLYCRPRTGLLECVEIDVSSQPGDTQLITGHDDVGAYFFPEGEAARVAFVDAGMHVPMILEFMRADANFADLFEGIDPVQLNEHDLELARFIVGRNYKRISIFEIADTSFGGVLPYFRVEAQGVTYDTLDMGYGEISVIYILWVLTRAPMGSLILVEEPETFLSPRAQTALVDVIAKFIKDRQLTVVMTSHSGPIAARMCNDEIIYATRALGQVSLHTPAKTADLVRRLGLVSDKVFVFFVEDAVAEIFTRVLIDNYSDRLSESVECVKCHGEGNVLRALEVIPAGIRRVAHVAVLDGDQRDKYEGNDKRVIFLPGEVAPECLLIGLATGLSHNDLGCLLGVSPADAAKAAAHADGDGLHDWLYTVAKTLSIPYSEIVRRLTIAWAQSNRASVEQFVKDAEKFSSAAPE